MAGRDLRKPTNRQVREVREALAAMFGKPRAAVACANDGESGNSTRGSRARNQDQARLDFDYRAGAHESGDHTGVTGLDIRAD